MKFSPVLTRFGSARAALRHAVCGAARVTACAALMAGTLAQAQDFPNRPVRIVIPTAPGGQPDQVSRILSENLGKTLGQPVVIENIAGSGGVAAIASVQAAPADGHSMFIGDAAHWAITPAMRPKTTPEFLKIFTPVRMTHTTSIVLVTATEFPANNLRELVAHVKARPKTFSYGSAGVGSVHHLGMEAFKGAFGLDILHVPYKSSSLALPAIVGGQVSMMFTGLPTVQSFVKSGRIKMIALSNKQRSPADPSVVPVAEAGGPPDFDYGSAAALFVRAGTAQPVIDKLADAIEKAFQAPDVIARLKSAGVQYVAHATPQSTLEFVRADVPRWANAVRLAGAVE